MFCVFGLSLLHMNMEETNWLPGARLIKPRRSGSPYLQRGSACVRRDQGQRREGEVLEAGRWTAMTRTYVPQGLATH